MIEVVTENKRCPAWIQQRITRAGGRNLYGQPNFRLVWGWSRLTWVGGKWEEWDDGRLKSVVYEYRQVPKYDPFFRWHVEKWMPPSFYGSPDQWYASTLEVIDGRNFHELGPYPSRGEYEHCWTLQEAGTGRYITLDCGAADKIVQAVIRGRELVHKDKRASLEKLRERQRKAEQEWEKFADDVLDDAFPAFGLTPHAVVPGEVEIPTRKETLTLAKERFHATTAR